MSKYLAKVNLSCDGHLLERGKVYELPDNVASAIEACDLELVIDAEEAPKKKKGKAEEAEPEAQQ